jgi:hypothetical protein
LRAAAIGAILGLGILTKVTDGTIMPFVWICLLLMAVYGKTNWKRSLLAILLFTLVVGIEIQGYIRANYARFGLPIPMQEAIMNHRNGVHLGDYFALVRSKRWPGLLTLWRQWIFDSGLWVGGWSFLQPAANVITIYKRLFIAAALGWPIAWLFRMERIGKPDIFKSASSVPLAIVLSLCVLAGMTLHSIESIIAWGASETVPWYAALAMPWLLIAFAASALAWRKTRLGFAIAFIPPGFLVVIEFFEEVNKMIRAYADESPGIDAIRRLATLHPPALGSFPLVLSAILAISALAAAFYLCVKSIRSPAPKLSADVSSRDLR